MYWNMRHCQTSEYSLANGKYYVIKTSQRYSPYYSRRHDNSAFSNINIIHMINKNCTNFISYRVSQQMAHMHEPLRPPYATELKFRLPVTGIKNCQEFDK